MAKRLPDHHPQVLLLIFDALLEPVMDLINFIDAVILEQLIDIQGEQIAYIYCTHFDYFASIFFIYLLMLFVCVEFDVFIKYA